MSLTCSSGGSSQNLSGLPLNESKNLTCEPCMTEIYLHFTMRVFTYGSGMVPESLLLLSFKCTSLVRFTSPDGTVPLSKLLCKTSVVMLTQLLSSFGMVPVSWL